MTLDLTPQELEYLVQSLAQRPYGECWMLIEKIKEQVHEQQQQPQLQAVG